MTWTNTPTQWSNGFFDNLFGHEWELTKSPAGANQWVAKDADETVPDAHDPDKSHRPTMLTTDLALRFDPAYEKISRRFHEHPDEFALAFAKAWYKLLHRDMGPLSRYLGPWVPEPQLWQDPVPAVDHELIGDEDVAALKAKLLDSGLSVSQLASTAWASAASFRGTDNRGGANGARIRLEPQRSWEVNEPAELAKVLQVLEKVQQRVQRRAVRWQRRSRWPTSSSSAAVRRSSRPLGMPVTRSPCRSGRAAPTPRRSRPTRTRSPCSSLGPTASATTCGRARSSRPRRCCSTVRTCST